MTPKLLTIAHSYVVNVNRRLAHEMARQGEGRWEVTAVAPVYFHGGNDIRPVTFEPMPDEPCRVEAVPARFTRKVHLFTYSRRLKRLMCEGWDFVHCWEEPYILAGGQIAWWTPKQTPMAFWTAQNLQKRYPPPFGRIERYCLKRCDGWMACGQSVVDAMLPRGYAAKPYRIMPLGVDLERFVPSGAQRSGVLRELNWGDSAGPIIGYLGRFTEAKGMRVLMAALDAVRSPWRLLLVGAGEMEGE
ncbi:MAG TPA: glycosyltransferase, partial [Tepidisphaeraceae bacterium]|nr:glycosyltransferase [Tepidisphaeraceae bacterium]